jgi:hypothetical protein
MSPYLSPEEFTKRYLDEVPVEPPEAPLPLFPPLSDPIPYPVDALGGLAEGAKAIARQVQSAPCMAGNSVLAVASLAAQVIADVVLPIGGKGQARPLSLDLVTIAPSGDRKTTTDHEALRPARLREKILREAYAPAFENWRVTHTAWKAELRRIERSGKLDLDQRRNAIRDLGPEPVIPIKPILTVPDLTVQGLARTWSVLPKSLGAFTSEGSQITAGYGFDPDRRLATAAVLSSLWDGGDVRRLRAGDDELIDLRGRRLSLHLMIQPDAATAFLGDPILRNQGLLSRVLIAAPVSLAGTRMFKEPDADCDRAIRSYTERIANVFEAWTGEPPRLLSPDADARGLWITFYNHVESKMRESGSLAELKDVGSKSAEQAARIAGVLALVADPGASEITVETMANAVSLATWYLDEAKRLAEAPRANPKLQAAQLMLDWLQRERKTEISVREAQRLGPNSLREKALILSAFATLSDHGWLKSDPAYKRRWTVAAQGGCND